MIKVICSFIILTQNGAYRQEIRAPGILIREDKKYWMVDFTEEITKRYLNTEWNNYVQKVDGNKCSYVNN